MFLPISIFIVVITVVSVAPMSQRNQILRTIKLKQERPGLLSKQCRAAGVFTGYKATHAEPSCAIKSGL